MSQLSLTEGNVRRALSRFAIPFLGASLLQFLYGAVDLIVVGPVSYTHLTLPTICSV